MEYYSHFKKEGNPITCNNMDGPGIHYTKWNKSVTEEWMVHDSS